MNVLLMLQLYRRAAVPFVAENIKLFKQLSAADQTELLYYMIMDLASAGNGQTIMPGGPVEIEGGKPQ
jgi:hypothetical protein